MADIEDMRAALIKADAAARAGDPTAAADAATLAQAISAYRPDVTRWTERTARGVLDVGQGIKQLFLMATDPEAAAKYKEQTNAEIGQYEQRRGTDPGIDWIRGLGAAGPAIAATPLILAAAPEAATGVALGAGLGAVQGATTYNPEGSWASKAIQTAIGGAAGAGTQLVINKVVAPAASALWSRAAQGVEALKNQATGAVTPAAAEAAVREAFTAAGQDFNAVPLQQRQSLIDQAIAAAKSGQTIAPLPGTRAADFKSLGMEGTKGQLTRDPSIFTAEQEAAKLEGAGAPLRQRFVQQNQQLLEQIPGLQEKTGAATAQPYPAAESAREGVQLFAEKTQKAVGALYDAARGAAGADAEVPLQPIADSLGKVAEQFGPEHIQGAITNRLAQYGLTGGTQTKSLTVTEAELLRRFLGNQKNPSNLPQMAAIRMLQNSVDEAVGNVAAAGGDAGAASALQAARATAAARFKTLEPTPVAHLLDVNEAAPNFIQTKILGGKPGEVAALGRVLQQSAPQAWENIRASVLEHLMNKATLGDPQGLFSGARFNKALNDIGSDRLQVLFSPEELAKIGTIARVSRAVTTPPPLASVNYSNTASTLRNLMQSQQAGPGAIGRIFGMIPGIGPASIGAIQAGRQALGGAALGREIQSTVNPGPMMTPPIDYASARDQLARMLMRANPAATAGALQYTK